MDKRTERFREEYQGKRFFTKDGKQEFEITDARTYGDVDVTFLNSGLVKNTKVGNIKMGLPNPFIGPRGGDCPVCFDTPQHEYEGCIYPTNGGDHIQIIKYNDYNNVEYRFLDEHRYENSTTLQNIKKGQLKNPFDINRFGGYSGAFTEYNSKNFRWLYNIWIGIISRATGAREEYAKNTNTYLNTSAYESIKLDPTWLCYNSFANWYMSYYSEFNKDKFEFNVDKDLLYPYYYQFTWGNKCYSPSTCVLLPKDINILISHIDINNINNHKNLISKLSYLMDDALDNNSIDKDAYCVLKRFYINDPAYSNYITTRMESMKNCLGSF